MIHIKILLELARVEMTCFPTPHPEMWIVLMSTSPVDISTYNRSNDAKLAITLAQVGIIFWCWSYINPTIVIVIVIVMSFLRTVVISAHKPINQLFQGHIKLSIVALHKQCMIICRLLPVLANIYGFMICKTCNNIKKRGLCVGGGCNICNGC